MNLDKQKVKALYLRYGFDVNDTKEKDVIVCTVNNGHYYNADIVLLKENAKSEKIFEDYSDSGYACKTRLYKSLKDVETSLFNGFFNVKNSKQRLNRAYANFTKSLVSNFTENANYSYINSRYYINGAVGNETVVQEIKNRLNVNKPILFLIEAAAGFGKTCTAYELLNSIINDSDDTLPLFAELSRNRQAKIFRYVLLDEIDNFFPSLSSKLVRMEIKEGKVPVILDGFDELLHTSLSEKNDELNETMIETIGELLEGQAKVILTTRRTAVFDGDDFHEWINSHKDNFEIIRIKIDEPTVSNWLSEERIDILNNYNVSIEKLSNPVLLSFLRSISDDEFTDVVCTSYNIVEKYFELMLNREKDRQDLQMTVQEQYDVFTRLAKDMIDLSYTSESREYITTFFLEYEQELLETVKNRYSIENRPTIDEIANKLSGHALLDKMQIDNKAIGFINEFVLGNFCAENIISSGPDEYIEDTRFIAPAVISYIPRNSEKRKALWDSLEYVIDYINTSDQFKYMISLNNKVNKDIADFTVEDLSLKDINLGEEYIIDNTLFINCDITNANIYCNNIHDVSFINCNFYGSNILEYTGDMNIAFLGCTSDNNFHAEVIEYTEKNEDEEDREKNCEIYILEKFWNKGRNTFYKHRHIKGIYTGNSTYSHKEMIKALDKLKKKEFILDANKISFLELNITNIHEIKLCMGKIS